jgi:AcrB/AcrD/AcrF family protein
MIGVTLRLLITRQPFGFVALLAAMSLAGMMVKNAIVLVDEIDALQAAGQDPFDAVINAAVSRLRPVLLAAGTTVLGVIPLLSDVFWVSMSVVIMFGLTLEPSLRGHPEYLQFLREICRKLGITPFDMLRAEAARFSRTYLDSRTASGELTWKDFQTEMACVLEEFAIKEAGGSRS